ncbi:probable ubiquitin-conjugating enzyme E2 23 [Phragmites australis]|uniref:probable ubiquitin-conjugating enzyme E2 23 n=1 Tax=Phragmites australis TaxID=29695 RepID=UPI002D7721D6|nr:probable ubiquitin-conjugating enzyme E2 23 [Phragmites australis]
MKDAAGLALCYFDTVMFKKTGAHGDRGVVMEVMPGKRLSVLCVDGTEVVQKARDITVVDRSFLYPGMAVASASDLSGQAGVVTGVSTALDLVQLDGEPTVVARDVSPAEVQRVRELNPGDYVVSGPWLGRVLEASLDVDVLFDDGAVCRVTVSRPGRELEATMDKDKGNSDYFYPGQPVVGHGTVFKASRWLKGYWKPTRVKGTVAKVEMAGVLVYWVASSQMGTERSLFQASAPPAYQHNSHNLTFFCSGDGLLVRLWIVSERCFFRSPHCRGRAPTTCRTTATASNLYESSLPPASTATADEDGQESPSAAARGLTRTHRNRLRMGVKRMRRLDRRRAEFELSMSVADVRTTVDVLWQDGTRQYGVPSATLHPIWHRNERDFFPGQRVIRSTPSHVAAPTTATDLDAAGPAAARFGIVRSLNYKDQTVCVSWLKAATCAGEYPEVDCDETMSVYDNLRRSFDHKLFYGNIVVRLQPTDSARVDGDGGRSTEEPVPAQRNKKKGAADDLSWVGHIVDLCDAKYLQVKWGDGNTSKVLPHEIAVVKPQSVDKMLHDLGDWVYEDGDEDDAVDKAQEDTPQELAAADDEADDDSSSDSDGEDGPAAARTTGLADAVAQAMIRLYGEVLAQGKRYLVNGSAALASRLGRATTVNIETPAPVSGGGDDKEAAAAVASASDNGGDGSAGQGKAEADATGGGDDSFRFLHFEVVQSPPDHHYLNNLEQGTGGGRKWIKRVQKEWKILENNLPDTIYLRAFEDRMDLLRVAMVGASGTPYHDGLFFFDLQLPPSYPAVPPLVNYRSFGLRVNPNLYQSGTVCLSLLDTFGGKGTELWSPEASNVLQVVVSIQGLVLTAQPYYNEAGYAAQVGTPEGRRNELPYSENTYLLTLQTMLHLLRRPPAGFEAFVRHHFHHRGRHVLRACEAYLAGCLVGTLDGEARATELSRKRPCSVGFRLALANVVPRLVEAFNEIDADGCEQFDRLRAAADEQLLLTKGIN